VSAAPRLPSGSAQPAPVGSWTDNAVRRLLRGLSREELVETLELRQSPARLRMTVAWLLLLLAVAIAASIPLAGAMGRLAATLRTFKEYGGSLSAFILLNLIYVRLREDGLLLVAALEAFVILWILAIAPRLPRILRSIAFGSGVALVLDERGIEDRRPPGMRVSWDDLIAVRLTGIFLIWIAIVFAPPRGLEGAGAGRHSWRGRRRFIFATPLDMPNRKLIRILRIRQYAHEHQRLAVALAAMNDSQPSGLAAMPAPADERR
jgi:hypothetical protein